MEASSLKSTLEGLQEKLLASMGADAAAAEGARIVAEAAAEARDAEATATLGIPGPKARNKRAFEYESDSDDSASDKIPPPRKRARHAVDEAGSLVCCVSRT